MDLRAVNAIQIRNRNTRSSVLHRFMSLNGVEGQLLLLDAIQLDVLGSFKNLSDSYEYEAVMFDFQLIWIDSTLMVYINFVNQVSPQTHPDYLIKLFTLVRHFRLKKTEAAPSIMY